MGKLTSLHQVVYNNWLNQKITCPHANVFSIFMGVIKEKFGTEENDILINEFVVHSMTQNSKQNR